MNFQREPYILGVDLDGVTAKYNEGLGEYMKRYHGWNDSDIVAPDSYNFIESRGWPFRDFEEFMSCHNDFVFKGGFRTLEPMENVSEVLNSLVKRNNVHVRIITKRFWENGAFQNVVSSTAFWLDKHNIPYDSFCVVSDKTSVGCDLLIDDSPSNVESVRQHGGYAVIFDQEYNKHIDNPRVMDWNDAHKFVLNHMEHLGYDVVR